jgi:hypothetical protein
MVQLKTFFLKAIGMFCRFLIKPVIWLKCGYSHLKRSIIAFLKKTRKNTMRLYIISVNWLAQDPQKRIAKIGSHAICHICILGVVLYLGFKTYYDTINISPTKIHNIRLSFDPVINPDSINLYDSKCYGIGSCSVLIHDERVNKLTKGKYHNAIELSYTQDGVIYKDSVEITITRTPHSHPIECFVVNNDSLIPAKKTFDSLQVSSFLPNMIGTIPMPIPPDMRYTYILICCDDFGIDESNPNYCYRLLFGGKNSKYFGNAVSFKFLLGEKDNNKRDDFNYFSERAISFDQLIPVPDINTGDAIIYNDTTKTKEIFNSGIYIKATDLDKEHQRNNKEFQSSVIAGLFLAFALDIIVQLVIKWRNLVRRKEAEQ